jgi:hypothetical protein
MTNAGTSARISTSLFSAISTSLSTSHSTTSTNCVGCRRGRSALGADKVGEKRRADPEHVVPLLVQSEVLYQGIRMTNADTSGRISTNSLFSTNSTSLSTTLRQAMGYTSGIQSTSSTTEGGSIKS